MQNTKIPENYNYAEAYLTFRCNFKCPYCINKAGEFVPRKEMSGEEWVEALNKIDFGNISLTLGGGEPTLHKDFFQIVNNLKPEIKIDLLTNLNFDVDEFINNVSPERFTQSDILYYHPIRVSYHATQSNRIELISKAKLLQNAGFNLGIFGLNHPHLINENMAMTHLAMKNGVALYQKDFLGEVDGKTFGYYKYPKGLDRVAKSAMCKTRELLIAPDGNVYRCHRDLYTDNNPIGNIKDNDFEIQDTFRPCSKYGECNPCDLKAKTNKFLRGIDCQVEIYEK